MKVKHTTPPHPRASRWTLRFILLGGAVAWLLHLLFAYVIAEFGTLSGLGARRWGPTDTVTALLLILSVAMIMLAAFALMVSWRQRARWGQQPEPLSESDRVERFCARFGVSSNLVFLVIVLAQTIPIFFFRR